MPTKNLFIDGQRSTDATTEGRVSGLMRLRRFTARHRVTIQDLSGLFAIMVVATFLAFEFDIYKNQDGISRHEQTIELDEALTLGGLLCVGLLIFSLRRYQEQKHETRRRTAAEQQVREPAFQDPLTGLANRRQFDEALNAAIASPPRAGASHAVLLLDLNGFKTINDLQSDAKASTRFHRIVRRGREYGSRVSMEEALVQSEDTGTHGIHFICLVANIARQFEFLQSAWLMNTKFDALTDESDPLLGNREPVPGAAPTDTFTRPYQDGVRDRICSLPQFVSVEGGAYFFLPSIAAIRYLSRNSGEKHLAEITTRQ